MRRHSDPTRSPRGNGRTGRCFESDSRRRRSAVPACCIGRLILVCAYRSRVPQAHSGTVALEVLLATYSYHRRAGAWNVAARAIGDWETYRASSHVSRLALLRSTAVACTTAHTSTLCQTDDFYLPYTPSARVRRPSPLFSPPFMPSKPHGYLISDLARLFCDCTSYLYD